MWGCSPLNAPCDLPVLWGTVVSPGTRLLFMPTPQGMMPHSDPQKHPHDPSLFPPQSPENRV